MHYCRSAKDEGVGLIIEIDSNAWAGNSIIPRDPNIQNSNGKLLEKFLERNKNVTLVNALPLCEGLITRKRITNCLNEQSVLDLYMDFEQVLLHVAKMHVDEKGDHQLTNFYGMKHTGKVTESDHAKVEIELNIKLEVSKPHRQEAYNFKNKEFQAHFKDITTNTNRLRKCFLSDEPFDLKSN